MNKKKLTIEEFSRMGGKATYKKYGKEHYQSMAENRWKKRKDKMMKKEEIIKK